MIRFPKSPFFNLIYVISLLRLFIFTSDVARDLISMKEVPVLHLNFYLMGRNEVNSSDQTAIKKCVDFLNEEFGGNIQFELNLLTYSEGFANLSELHQEFLGVEERKSDLLVKHIEKKGSINIFIFESEEINSHQEKLMGFTPIFKTKYSDYASVSPSFDRIFLSYNGLRKKSTLVHEMGHFLGLNHPWEMTEIEKENLGLNSEDVIARNYMAYGNKVNEFTSEQLEEMYHFAIEFRDYLIVRTDYIFSMEIVSNIAK